LERGQPAHPHQLGCMRERCKLPQRGPGRCPGRRRVFLYSERSDCLSQHVRTCCVQFASVRYYVFLRGYTYQYPLHINSWGVRSPAYPPLPTPVERGNLAAHNAKKTLRRLVIRPGPCWRLSAYSTPQTPELMGMGLAALTPNPNPSDFYRLPMQTVCIR